MNDRNVERVGFHINWGIAQGAIPKRVLAHICRRGGIRGADVGAIKVLTDVTRFDIAAEVADAFARRVESPDPREPHLVIERDRGFAGGRDREEPRHGAPPRHFAPRVWSKRARTSHAGA